MRPHLAAVTHSQTAPADLIELYDRILSQAPHTMPYVGDDDIDADQAPPTHEFQILSQYYVMSNDFCPDSSALYSIRCALATYIRHVSTARGLPDGSAGLMRPILHVAAGLVDIVRQIASPLESNVHSLPRAILLESVGLGLDAIRLNLSYFPLSRRSRMDIAQISISTCLYAQLTPELPPVEAQHMLRKATDLLRSLFELHKYSQEANFIIHRILTYPINHPVVSLNAPSLLFDLLQSVTKSDSNEGGEWLPRCLVASIRELDTLLVMIPVTNRLDAIQFLREIDKDRLGLVSELLSLHSQRLEEATNLINGGSTSHTRALLLQRLIEEGCFFLYSFITTRGDYEHAFRRPEVAGPLASAMFGLLHADLLFDSLSTLVQALDPACIQLHPDLAAACAVLLLRESHVRSGLTAASAYQRCHNLLTIGGAPPNMAQQVATEIGRSLARIESDEAGLRQFDAHEQAKVAEAGLWLLSWAASTSSLEGELAPLYGLSRSGFDALCGIFGASLPIEKRAELGALRSRFMFITGDGDEAEDPRPFDRPSIGGEPSFSYEELFLACGGSASSAVSPFDERPTTPLGATVGAVVALMSPAILRSPSITGPTLHKKYSAQDFRLARLSPTSTSRPPSTHVDVSIVEGDHPHTI